MKYRTRRMEYASISTNEEEHSIMKGYEMRKLVLLALFTAQAVVLSFIESFIPIPVAMPGVKLGLANIITLICLVFFGLKETIIVVLARCLLSSLMGGSMVVLLYSVAGGILSTLVMFMLYRKLHDRLSLTGISMAGAAAHNAGQLGMASLILRDVAVFSYIPVLLISGLLTGLFIGLIATYLKTGLEKTNIINKWYLSHRK